MSDLQPFPRTLVEEKICTAGDRRRSEAFPRMVVKVTGAANRCAGQAAGARAKGLGNLKTKEGAECIQVCSVDGTLD